MERVAYYMFIGLMAIAGLAVLAGGLWMFGQMFLWALAG